MVWPTMSGKIVLSRDQVLSTCLPPLTGRQPNLGPLSVASHQLVCSACPPHHLTPSTRLELDIVNLGSQGDVLQFERVPGGKLRRRTRADTGADFQTGRRQDVALL